MRKPFAEVMRPIAEVYPIPDNESVLIWDGTSYHVAWIGWHDAGEPVWFNGDVSVIPTDFAHLPEEPDA